MANSATRRLSNMAPYARHMPVRTHPHPLRSNPPPAWFPFSTTGPRLRPGRNRMYQSVRSAAELDTLLLQTASSRTPLLTLWTASWCRTCSQVLPFVRTALEKYQAGEQLGGVAFAEVEFDAPGNEELGQRYMITSIPTLLAFSRQEPQMGTRITSPQLMLDHDYLCDWIETESMRRSEGGAGGKGPLGKLFDTFGKD